jgi:hypothetical protein
MTNRAYQAILGLYPADYRALFSEEMLRAFKVAARDRQAQGKRVFYGFVLAEWMGLMAGAVAEWTAKLTTDAAVRGRTLPDLRMMRPPSIARELWFAGASAGAPDEVMAAQRRVDGLVGRMVDAIAHHDFRVARACSFEEREAREQLLRLREKHRIA